MRSMTIGKKIDMLLDRLGKSAADLSRESDVSQTSIANYKKRKTVPQSLRNALLIARALGVSLDYLADDAQDEPARPPSDFERRVIELAYLVGDEEEALRRLVAGEKKRDPHRAVPGTAAFKTSRVDLQDPDQSVGKLGNGAGRKV